MPFFGDSLPKPYTVNPLFSWKALAARCGITCQLSSRMRRLNQHNTTVLALHSGSRSKKSSNNRNSNHGKTRNKNSNHSQKHKTSSNKSTNNSNYSNPLLTPLKSLGYSPYWILLPSSLLSTSKSSYSEGLGFVIARGLGRIIFRGRLCVIAIRPAIYHTP